MNSGKETDEKPSGSEITRVGRNCWKRVPAWRVKLYYDSDSYYRAFSSAARRARRSILIVGWDIHSRLKLNRDPDADGYPDELGNLLNRIASEKKDLHVHILSWDWAMIYMFEREILPVYRLDWKTHRRVHFKLDRFHPLGASQHQKIAVIDDLVAFTGGIDLGPRRWDTIEHHPLDERRRDPQGEPYPPFHDMQMGVEGPAAAALGDLVRDRWHRATGEELEKPVVKESPWPEELPVEFKNIPVTISRTYPEWMGNPEVREIERLLLDSIAAARKTIYLEDQYVTSNSISGALCERLEDPDGPEVIIVTRKKLSSWMEEGTLGLLRFKFIEKLRNADRHNRFEIYHTAINGDKEKTFINLHSKIAIIDNRLFRIGSANLSNRSMGVDSECDLSIESEGKSEIENKIANIRSVILSGHLDSTPEEFKRAEAGNDLLRGAIEKLRGSRGKTLIPLREEDVPAILKETAPDFNPADPEKPIDPDILLDSYLPEEEEKSSIRSLVKLVVGLVVLLTLAAVWRWTPLGDWLDPELITGIIALPESEALTALVAVGAYVVAGFVMIPLTALVVGSAVIFGPLKGFLYSMAGAMASSAIMYWIGRYIWHDAVRRIAGDRLNYFIHRINSQSIAIVTALRLVPVAPFTIVNMVAGSTRLRFSVFMAGSFLGFIPGILAVTLLSDRLLYAVNNPALDNITIAAGIVAGVIILTLIVRRFVRKKIYS